MSAPDVDKREAQRRAAEEQTRRMWLVGQSERIDEKAIPSTTRLLTVDITGLNSDQLKYRQGVERVLSQMGFEINDFVDALNRRRDEIETKKRVEEQKRVEATTKIIETAVVGGFNLNQIDRALGVLNAPTSPAELAKKAEYEEFCRQQGVGVRVLRSALEKRKKELEDAAAAATVTAEVRPAVVTTGATRPVDAARGPETLSEVDAYLVSRGYSVDKVATMTPLAKDKHAAGLRGLNAEQKRKYDEVRTRTFRPDWDDQRRTFFINDALKKRWIDNVTYDALEKMFVATEVQLMRTATEQIMVSAVQRGSVGEDASEIMTLSENNVRYDDRLSGARCIGPDGEFMKLERTALDRAKSVVVSLVGGGNVYRVRMVGREGVDELLKLKPNLEQAKNGRYKVDVSSLEQLILNAGIDSANMSKVLGVLIDPVHADGGAFADVAVSTTSGKEISYASSGFDPQPLLERIKSRYGIDTVTSTLGWMVCEYLALRKDPNVGKSILEPLFKPDEIIDPSPGSQYQVGTMNPLKAVITRGAFARSNTSLGSLIGDVAAVTGMSRETLASGGWVRAIKDESALKMADQVNASLAILKVLNRPAILTGGDGQLDAKGVWKEALGALKQMKAQGQISEATAEQVFRLMTEYVYMSLQVVDPIVVINREDSKGFVESGNKAYDLVKQVMIDPTYRVPDKDGRATVTDSMVKIYNQVNDRYQTKLRSQMAFAIDTEIDPTGNELRRENEGRLFMGINNIVADVLHTALKPGSDVVRGLIDVLLGRRGR